MTPRRRMPRTVLLAAAVVVLQAVTVAASPASASATVATTRRGGVAVGASAAAMGPWGRGRIQQVGRHRASSLPPLASIPNPWAALKALTAAYSDWLYREPIRANIISGTAIVALGDVISQFIERDDRTGRARCTRWRDLEPRRIANAGFSGTVFNGLLLPQWYLLIHRVLPVETAKTIACKIASNMVVWGCLGNAAIMLMRRMLDGESYASSSKAIKRDLWAVMKTDYCIWPAYDVLCFTVIPRHLQSMATGTLGVAWAAYLSFVTHTDAPADEAPAAGAGAGAADQKKKEKTK